MEWAGNLIVRKGKDALPARRKWSEHGFNCEKRKWRTSWEMKTQWAGDLIARKGKGAHPARRKWSEHGFNCEKMEWRTPWETKVEWAADLIVRKEDAQSGRRKWSEQFNYKKREGRTIWEIWAVDLVARKGKDAQSGRLEHLIARQGEDTLPGRQKRSEQQVWTRGMGYTHRLRGGRGLWGRKSMWKA